jgi:CelD/BcsL family acetyltransferase involved in cellulose biosynthesis
MKYKDILTYKYGCSDTRYNNLGGMQLLFWRSICEAKEQGLQVFDLGRSDSDEAGLITFKDRWGAKRSTLTYCRYFVPGHADTSFGRANSGWKFRAAKRVFAHMPDAVLSAAGKVLYKHIG